MNSPPPPLVSVIIPAYNVAPFIAEAVASVLAQTYTAYELIIVNDGSPDTPALEAALAPFAGRMTYLTQDNRGAAAARNAGIAAARGSLLAFLDGDDLWDPEFLASQVAFLLQGGYDMVYCNARLFGEAGRDNTPITALQGVPDLAGLLTGDCHPPTTTTVVRKQVVGDAGLFDEGIRRGHDFDLWVRLAFRGARIQYQRTTLASVRLRPDSLSGNEIQRIEREIDLFNIFRRKLALEPTHARLVEERLRRLTAAHRVEQGKEALITGDYARATALFRSAWPDLPSLKLLLVRLSLAFTPGLLRRFYLRSLGSA